MRHRHLLSPTTSSIAGDRLVRLRDVVRGVASSASPNRNKTGGPRANTKTHNATTPRVNGAPLDYAPTTVFNSPYMHSVWNSGRITITQGSQSASYDFSNTANPVRILG